MTFGEEMKTRRMEIGMTKRRLSDKTKISYSRLAKLESNFKPETIMMETAIKLSDALHWNIKDIAICIRKHLKYGGE